MIKAFVHNKHTITKYSTKVIMNNRNSSYPWIGLDCLNFITTLFDVLKSTMAPWINVLTVFNNNCLYHLENCTLDLLHIAYRGIRKDHWKEEKPARKLKCPMKRAIVFQSYHFLQSISFRMLIHFSWCSLGIPRVLSVIQ